MKHKHRRKRNRMDDNTKDTLVSIGRTITRVAICIIRILAKSVKFLAEQVDNACSKNGHH